MLGKIPVLFLLHLVWVSSGICATGEIILEAEDIPITRGVIVVRELPDMPGGLFVEKNKGLVARHESDVQLEQPFTCETTGAYCVWVRCLFSPQCYNQVSVTIDRLKAMSVSDLTFLKWHWVNSETFHLNQGDHVLRIEFDNNIGLDRFVITRETRRPPIFGDSSYQDDFEKDNDAWAPLHPGLWRRSQDDTPRLNYAMMLEESDQLEYTILDKEFRDYAMDVDVKPDSVGDATPAVGMIFDYENSTKFNMLLIAGRTFSLVRSGKIIATGIIKDGFNRGYNKLSLLHSGSLLRCYLNDNRMLERSDFLLAKGRIGLGGKGTRISFDNLRLNPASVYFYKPGSVDFGDLGNEWSLEKNRISCKDSVGAVRVLWGRDEWANYEVRMSFGRAAGEQGLYFHSTKDNAYLCRWDGVSVAVMNTYAKETETVTSSPLALRTSNQITLKTFNGRTKIFINGMLAADFNERPGSGGQFGLYASRGFTGWFGDISLHSVTDFTDTFLGGNRNSLAGWYVLSGNWRVVEPSSSSQMGLGDSLTVSTSDESLIVTKEKSFSECIAEFKIIPTLQGNCGALFSYQNQQNFYSLGFAALPEERKHRVRLSRKTDGIESILAEREVELDSEQWALVVIKVAQTGLISVLIDGREILRAEGKAPCPGRFGFFSRNGEGTYFDDLLIQSLPSCEAQ